MNVSRPRRAQTVLTFGIPWLVMWAFALSLCGTMTTYIAFPLVAR